MTDCVGFLLCDSPLYLVMDGNVNVRNVFGQWVVTLLCAKGLLDEL